jgi:phytanoyl-CoA hydroxylase
MYIFKQPLIGDAVTSHQDSTFLHTTPRTTCLGLWLALQDATLENGCLWARPGSHLEPVRRQFVRNPGYFQNGTGPMMTFRDLVSEEDRLGWEGGLPAGTGPEVFLFEAFLPFCVFLFYVFFGCLIMYSYV